MLTLQFFSCLPQRLDIEREIRSIILQNAFHTTHAFRFGHIITIQAGGTLEESAMLANLAKLKTKKLTTQTTSAEL